MLNWDSFRYKQQMEDKCLIEFEKATFRLFTRKVFEHTSLKITAGEHLAILGNNASGKTTFAKALTAAIPSIKGKASFHIPYTKIAYVSFSSSLKLTNNADDAYLQQRWQSFDVETAPLVKDFFWPKQMISEETKRLLKEFKAIDLLEKRNIQLSNGELRKIELVKALSSQPALMVLDNAFVGLDVGSRAVLRAVLKQAGRSCTLILIALEDTEIPDFISRKVYCKDMQLVDKADMCEAVSAGMIPSNLFQLKPLALENIVALHNVNIAYGKHIILHSINWRIKPKEHWALIGPNGSGKSTILSLLVGDNPQAYAEHIYLFGKHKGSGETIWDIKRKIGFISPELHQFSPKHHLIREILIDDMLWLYPGTNRREVLEKAKGWLKWFGLNIRLEGRFGAISSGEQRLLLFIRSLIYPFSLFIADEPCQGLDEQNIQKVRAVFKYLAEESEVPSIFVTHKQTELPETTTLVFDLREENRQS